MKKYLLWLILCITMQYYSQTITVIDKSTREAIPGVVIKNKENAVLTNAKGKANLSSFNLNDSIQAKCIGYQLKWFVIKEKDVNFRIELTESNIDLEEVIVSASRWEEEEKENAVRVEKLNMKDMALQNPQTTADLLGAGSGVYIQKSQQGGGSPMLRGFATNRVMLVVDGVRMNNAIFRSGNVQNVISIDANSLESAEVLFGPGAVMYGSDAIGGVMDFHTRKATLSDSSKPIIKLNALARYATANNENTSHFDINIGFKKIAFLSSITYSKYNDLMAGTIGGDSAYWRSVYQKILDKKDTQIVNHKPSLQLNSGFSQLNFMQKIVFAPSKNLIFDYAYHYSATSNVPRYDRLIADANKDGVLDFSEWYYGPQIWQMHRLGLSYNNKTKMFDHFKFIAAYQQFEESRHDRRLNASGSTTSGNARLRNQFEKLDAYSFNLDLDKKLGEKTVLYYGAEYIFNKINSNAQRVNVFTNVEQKVNPRYPNGSTWQLGGLYLSLKHKFNEKLIFNSGLRYSYYSIYAKFDTTLFVYPVTESKLNNDALNGSMGIVFTPVKNISLYANASTGFRAPNIDDIGKVFDSQPGAVVVPNPNLKGEYAYNGEVGLATIFGNRLKLDAALFYTYLKNALVRRPFNYNGKDSIEYNGEMSKVFALQNATHAYVYGLQSNLEIYFGYGFSLRNSITMQSGKEYNSDSTNYFPLSHAVPLYGSIHALYAAKRVKADFYFNYNGRVDYTDLPLSERLEAYLYAKDKNGNPYVPFWYTLNFKVSYFVSYGFSLTAGVENITDQLYRPFASGISAPGRNFIASLRYKF